MQENRRLEELRDEFLGVYKLIATIINQVHLAIRHTQETEALYLAIQQLNVGHLSHHLLPADVLAKTLSKMTRQLRRTGSGLRLVHQDTDYYYETANVGAAVHSSNGSFVFFIVLYAPVTSDALLSPLTVWQLHLFPLKSPNAQNYYTVLATSLKYIAYNSRVQYYLAADNFLDIPLNSDSKITTYIDIHDVPILFSLPVTSNAFAFSRAETPVYVYRWDKGDLSLYNLLSGDLFSRIYHPSNCIDSESECCQSTCHLDIDI